MIFVKVKLSNDNVFIKYDYLLKMDNVIDLYCYHKYHHNKIITDGVENMLESREWLNFIYPEKTSLADHSRSFIGNAIIKSIKNDKSLFQAIDRFSDGVFKDQLKTIEKYGRIYIQQSGSYFPKHVDTIEYGEIIESDTYTWPKQIRVIQWPNGEHYYAKIGDIDVVWEGEQKWSCKSEALEKAQIFLNTMDDE